MYLILILLKETQQQRLKLNNFTVTVGLDFSSSEHNGVAANNAM